MSQIINYILGIPLAYAQVSSQVDKVGENTSNELTKLITNIFAQIPLWIVAFLVGVFSYILAVMVKRSIENKLTKEGIEEEHQEIKIVAGRSSFFGVLVIGITVALSIVGIDLKPIVAAGAFGLGFALQDIIMNLISGMMILASRHYTIGDVISVNGVIGKIEEIQTRATIIKAFDGTKVIVPNAELFQNVVVSKTSNPFRKLTFVMGVDYGADLKQTMDLTLAVIKNIPWVLQKPKPSVIFYEWGDYSINFRINVWIDSKGGKLVKVKNRVILDLTNAYNESGINIPYPIQTIQLDKAEEAALSQEEVNQRVANIKKKLANKNVIKTSLDSIQNQPAKSLGAESPGQSWLNQALHQVENSAPSIAQNNVQAPMSTPSNQQQLLAPPQNAPANIENQPASIAASQPVIQLAGPEQTPNV
ncbi:mechanosensitive ion channel family protein [Candidatus Peregrinibacteria bacterium]|nr:mechanosensitive ion channel family protein [Candidatus Peregrinibacteria bacterium]